VAKEIGTINSQAKRDVLYVSQPLSKRGRMTERRDLVGEHFSLLSETSALHGPLSEIVSGLARGEIDLARRRTILTAAGLLHDRHHRMAELDLLLGFVEAGLQSGGFSAGHQLAFSALKRVFDVQEGEFLECRAVELSTLLCGQLDVILEDNIIDPAEDKYQVALQDAFDLGYDQYLRLIRRSLEHARLRLGDSLSRELNPEKIVDLRRQLEALEPVVRLAELQQRTLGALF
jgi:hypothetical protein